MVIIRIIKTFKPFFNKLMNIGLVLVPTPDWWRERPIGTSTNAGRKVLSKCFACQLKLKLYMLCQMTFVAFHAVTNVSFLSMCCFLFSSKKYPVSC